MYTLQSKINVCLNVLVTIQECHCKGEFLHILKLIRLQLLQLFSDFKDIAGQNPESKKGNIDSYKF